MQRNPLLIPSSTALLLQHRRKLYLHIYGIIRDHAATEDVFQEVSLILLKVWEESGSEGNFWALGREIARRKSLEVLRKQQRMPLVFSSEALEQLDNAFEQVTVETDTRLEALTRCVQTLSGLWRQIVELRYWENLGVGAIAAQLHSRENSISVTLNRIRTRLAECVRRKLREEAP